MNKKKNTHRNDKINIEITKDVVILWIIAIYSQNTNVVDLLAVC